MIFSSAILAVIPSCCFILLAVGQLYRLRRVQEVVQRKRRSLILYGAKIAWGVFGAIASIVSLAGWLSTGENEAVGTAAAALAIPVSVSDLAKLTEHS